MTATLVLQLVEQVEVDLDAPVTTYLPDFTLAGGTGHDITVRQLLDHTSGISEAAGLERGDVVDDDPDALARLVGSLRESVPVGDPGEEHVYSSANYLVLGAMVERVTGQPFGEALAEGVLGPLGMDDTITTTEQADDAGLSGGNRFVFGRPAAYDAGYSASGVPYGYVASTLDDLTTYARFQLGADLPGARGVVSPSSLEQMHEAQVETSGPGRSYGLGWSVREVEGVDDTVVEHTGATPGYFAHVLLVPEQGIAVVLLADASSEAKAPALAGIGEDLLGVDWRTLLMWAPDLAWSLLAAIVLWGLAGVVSVARFTRPVP